MRLAPPGEVHGSVSSEHPPGEVHEARIMLNDLSPSGIGIYGPEPIQKGKLVTIFLQHPQAVQVEGRVIWCQRDDYGERIISQERYPYRIGVKFVFKTIEDEALFKTFCEDLQKNHLYAPKSAPESPESPEAKNSKDSPESTANQPADPTPTSTPEE